MDDIKKVKYSVLSTEDIESMGTSLEKKMTNFFNATIKRELRKYMPKKANNEHIMQVMCYSLAIQNAKIISEFAMMTKNPMVANSMMEGISKITQQYVYDFYEKNKKHFQLKAH